jgi:hypothetical protein
MICEVCQSALPEGALFCGECGSSLSRTHSIPVVAPVVEVVLKAEQKPQPHHVVAPPAQSFIAPALVQDEVEPETTSTNIVELIESINLEELFEAPPASVVEPPRFATEFASENELASMVSFSITMGNGDSVEITRSGLLGRMPTPEEGENFEHLIVVTDPGRSVSKTHLEFGVDGSELWISDRNSGNGTIVREPGVVPRRVQPGMKYTVMRGTRVDFGDLHLTIS